MVDCWLCERAASADAVDCLVVVSPDCGLPASPPVKRQNEDPVTSPDPTVRQLLGELANALQPVLLIAERLEPQTASVSRDASEIINSLHRATDALNAMRAAEQAAE